ncbi:hypothetical protein [Neobacillus thermocopriae]|uniref:hypothetical protein n=1 Tax=Neobacillus thermocopriae TaxID=1215031 RepID=UPI0037702C01
MNKRETFTLLKIIWNFYDQFVVDQDKVNYWYEAMKDWPLEEVQKNLLEFVRQSPYPPKVSELAPNKTTNAMSVPNLEETKVIITRQHKPASEEVAQRSMAQMRAILGIER